MFAQKLFIMLKSLLLALFLSLLLCKVYGQVPLNKAEAAQNLALATAALDRGEVDTVVNLLDKALAGGLDALMLENYIPGAMDIAKTLLQDRHTAAGIQILQQIRKGIQQQPANNTLLEINVCYQIARGFYFQQSYDSCAVYVMRNLQLLEEEVSTDAKELDIANHQNLLGAVYNATGKYLQAVAAYEKVCTIRIDKLGRMDGSVASAYNNIGNAYTNLRLFNKAVDAYNQCIEIRQEVLGKKRPSLGRIYFNTGNMYDEKGEYNNAIAYYDKAYAIYEESPEEYANEIADVFKNMAIAYKNKGAFQEASVFNQQAIQQYTQQPGDQSDKIAAVYTNMGVLQRLRKNYAEALHLFEEAWSLYQQTLEPNDPEVIAANNNLGIAYADTGDFEGALAQLKSTLLLIDDRPTLRELFANVHNDIADVYFQLGNLQDAKAYNLKALAIQQEIFGDKSYKLAITYNNLAKIAAAQNDRSQAGIYIQQALAANHTSMTAEDIGNTPTSKGFLRYEFYVESLMLKATTITSAEKPEPKFLLEAKYLYQLVDTILTDVQNELIASDDKLRFSEKIYDLSQRSIENSIRLANITNDPQYLEEAFTFSEKSKSNVLAQSLTANQAKLFAGIPASLTALEDQLQSDISYYKMRLAERPDSLEQRLYQNELFNAQQAYRNLVAKMESEYPFYFQLKYERSVPKVRAIQFTLPPATALVSYFTSDSVLYSFVITKDDFSVYQSSINEKFYEKQIGFRKCITNQLDADYVKLGYELRQTLFPFTLDRTIQSLILIPDGTLSKLSFEALLMQRTNPRNVNFKRLPYLINDYEVKYALSATLYYQGQSTVSELRPSSKGLFACAPVFAEPQEIGFFANGLRDPMAIIDPTTSRMLTLDGKYVTALPATADEVAAIAEVFQQNAEEVDVFLFKDANEKQLKQNKMGQSRYIHIATHGFINEDQPDLSGLLLFPDTTGQEDHIIYSGEVYSLKINAELVVLSACETGLGKVASGEGLLGLSRAFFYAGANNLIVSLWKVQDRATADLMVRFYEVHFSQQANDFGAPLRKAKLEMIRSDTLSHPYYWSAFVLIGR